MSFRFRHEMPLDTRLSCPIGIEQHIFRQDREKVDSRRKVIHTVLLEQNRQRLHGYHNPNELASLSQWLSAASCDGALMRGNFQELAMLSDDNK